MNDNIAPSKTIIFTVLFIIFFAGASTAGIKEQMDKYERWLKEEVALLISETEEREFNQLVTEEEKGEYIKIFWAKRDPSPGTPENEFKDEWYRRLAYVNRVYTQGTKKGWHSDRGKVYMFFGPPLSRTSTTPTKTHEDSGHGDMEPSATIWVREPYETWTYQPMPDLGLKDSFKVVFVKYQHDYDLNLQTPQDILRALKIFPQVVVFNPDLQSLPSNRFVLKEGSFEKRLIENLMAGGEEMKQISLEWKPIFTKAAEGETLVSFLIQLQPESLEIKEITIFGKIKAEEGTERDFLGSVKVEKLKDNRLLAYCGLPAKPDKYSMCLGIRHDERYSLVKSGLEVPDFGNGELNTSTLIISYEVRSSPGKEEEFNPFILGEYRAAPCWDNVFSRKEFLNLLFHIYNAEVKDNAVSLKIEYFLTSPEVAYKLNPQEIKQTFQQGKVLIGGTEIPLSPLNPGQYDLTLKMTDQNSGKFIEKRATFRVTS